MSMHLLSYIDCFIDRLCTVMKTAKANRVFETSLQKNGARNGGL